MAHNLGRNDRDNAGNDVAHVSALPFAFVLCTGTDLCDSIKHDMEQQPSFFKKLGWWWDSVQGLRAHINLFKEMHRLIHQVPRDEHGRLPEIALEQLRQQESMIGFCLLHVLLVYPVGSGRFFDD